MSSSDDSARWDSRPGLARLVRTVVVVAPILVSLVAVIAASRLIPRPRGLVPVIAWWVALTGLATLVLWLVDRFLRRMMPVVALFKLSLVFPDRAPSRFKTAIRAGSVRQLQRQLASGEYSRTTPQGAAEQLVALAGSLNAHDRMTRGHTERVRAYSAMIGEELGLDEDELELLNWSGLVHDIGKLTVPPEILNKPGKPTEEEWAVLREHPARADELIAPLRPWLGHWAESATQHHERFDGGGYPNGLAGDEITLAGRIVAVADAYDVMTSTRSYKKPMSSADARRELARNSGTQFDPEVVRAFLSLTIGRLRLVMGPLSSLVQFPAGSASLGSSAATGVGAVGSVVAAAALGLLTGPADLPPPEEVAYVAPEVPDVDLTGVEDKEIVASIDGRLADPVVSIELVGEVENGIAVLDDGTITFKPDPDFNGTVEIGYEVCFEDGSCDEAVIFIDIADANDAPVANPDVVTIDEDSRSEVDVIVNDTDIDGDELLVIDAYLVDHPNYSIVQADVTVEDGRVVVEPAGDLWGSMLVEYTIVDPDGATAISTLVVQVSPVDDAPLARPDVLNAYENTEADLDVLLNDFDADGDELSIVSVDEVEGGVASVNGSVVTFRPHPRYVGPASFTYTITDGNTFATADVDLTVIDITTTPLISGDSASVIEDQTVAIDVLANDLAPDSILNLGSVTAIANPAHGTVSWDGAAFEYVPDADWTGVDTFEYLACDLLEFCNAADVTVTVTPVNDAPGFAPGPNQSIGEDAGPQTTTAWATAITAGPANETSQTISFSVTNDNPGLFTTQPAITPTGALTYTTAPDANGTTILTITATDDGGTTDGGIDTTAAVTAVITVTPVNDVPGFAPGPDQIVTEDPGPQATNGWATAITNGPANEAGQTLAFNVTNTNPALFVTQPTVTSTGALTYTPASDANGTTTLTITATDSGGATNGSVDTTPAATATITITPVNDEPGFTPGPNQSVGEDAGPQTTSGWATAIATGPANEASQTISFNVTNDNPGLFTTQPAITPTGALTYSPAPDTNGAATITITATDSGGTANGGDDTAQAATATITITPINDAPSFTPGPNQSVGEDPGPQTTTGWATAIATGPANEASQTISFNVTNDNPALFTAQPTVTPAGALTYTPALNANGAATITITATDDGGTANGGVDTTTSVTATITVTPVNDDPTAVDDPATVVEDSVLGVTFGTLGNDSDVDGDTPQYGSADTSTVANGTVTDNLDGTFTYVPDEHYNGTETFTYTAVDGNGGSDTATVTITVTPTPDAPIASDDARITPIDTPLVVAAPGLLINDYDVDGESLTVATTPITPPSNGAVILAADGSYTYTPGPGYFGTDSFTYQVSDPGGLTSTATATITVDSGVVNQTHYLGNAGSSAWNYSLVTTPPPSSLPPFDSDSDGNPGLTIKNGGGGEGESDTDKYQLWTVTAGTAIALDGPVTLDLWSTIENYDLGETGHPFIYLYDCLAASCTKLAETDVHISNWNQGIANFSNRQLSLGSVTHTIAPGRDLVLRLQFKHDDTWVAMTSDYPSALNLTLANQAPVANADTATVDEDDPITNLNVLGNDVDTDIDPTTVTIVGPATSGTATPLGDGTVNYTPDPNANGVDSFTYQVCDLSGNCDTAVNTITINAVNDEPTFTGGGNVASGLGPNNQFPWALAIDAGAPDETGQTLTFVITANDNPALFATGPAIDSTTGALSYDATSTGTANITIQLTDDGGTLNGGDDTSITYNFLITIS